MSDSRNNDYHLARVYQVAREKVQAYSQLLSAIEQYEADRDKHLGQ